MVLAANHWEATLFARSTGYIRALPGWETTPTSLQRLRCGIRGKLMGIRATIRARGSTRLLSTRRRSEARRYRPARRRGKDGALLPPRESSTYHDTWWQTTTCMGEFESNHAQHTSEEATDQANLLQKPSAQIILVRRRLGV